MAAYRTYTARDFEARMEDFIAYCDSGSVEPTDYQLIKYLGISPAALSKYRAGDKLNSNSKEKSDGYSVALRKLDLYREDATIRQALSDPKLLSHCALKLRQAHWGGWSDKGDTAQDVQIRVRLGDGDRDLME